MNYFIVAVFNEQREATRAIQWLEEQGVPPEAISLAYHHFGKGILVGTARTLSPGGGEFQRSAWERAYGVFGLPGALVADSPEAVVASLKEHGIAEDAAEYYGREVERGATLLGVDLHDTQHDPAVVEHGLRERCGRTA
jgi:hypothetical protein